MILTFWKIHAISKECYWFLHEGRPSSKRNLQTHRQIIQIFKNLFFTWFSFREGYWGCRQAYRIQSLIFNGPKPTCKPDPSKQRYIFLPVQSPRGVIEEWYCNCCIGGWDPGSAQKIFRYFVLFSALPYWYFNHNRIYVSKIVSPVQYRYRILLYVLTNRIFLLRLNSKIY